MDEHEWDNWFARGWVHPSDKIGHKLRRHAVTSLPMNTTVWAVLGSVKVKLNATLPHTFSPPQHLTYSVPSYCPFNMRQKFTHPFKRKGKIEKALLVIINKEASNNLKNAVKLLFSGFKISHCYSLGTKEN